MALHTDNPQDLFILTPKSANRKVGKGTPVSMSTMATCPPSCKLREGCYATCGKLGLVWWKLSEGLLLNGVSFGEFCKRIVKLGPETTIWRHNQAGDLPGFKGRLHKGRCKQLSKANGAEGRNRGGYTFTHYSPLPIKGQVSKGIAAHNKDVVKTMNDSGFVVNLSADNPTHADKLVDLAIGPVTTLLPMDAPRRFTTPKGRTIIVCPAVVGKNINCVDCRVCANTKRRVIVGFPAHGMSKKKADKVARA